MDYCWRLTAVLIWAGLFWSSCLSSPISEEATMRCTDCKWTQNWELLSRVNLSGVLPVYKYRSKRTGLTVVLAQADSPVVNGYFCLATEAWTHDGLPHTLEHLIFLGSEDYPYKEVLDLMANRCLADRTNAWTDTDHTCYTVYTAGSSGFLNILPVYLDHIFHPLLREEDFMTEVHHVNADGEDAGVVYSEMQGVENRASNIIYFDLMNQLYPGNSSLTQQTGGRLHNLRESTTIEKVRAYHKKFYRPENMFLTITGNIDPAMLFAALDPVERKIMGKADEYPEFEKPFSAPLEPVEKDSMSVIKYPSEDEDFGWVAMAWRLPGNLADNYQDIHALSILSSYLSSTSVSPLMTAFVEIADPLATDVDIDILMNAESAISIDFENVPLNKMDLIEDKFVAALNSVYEDGINMDRLHTIIQRMVLSRKMNLENSPHLVVPDPAVLDMLYGNKPDQFYHFIKEAEEEAAKKILEKPESFWLDMMNVTFSRPKVMTKAYPSADLSHQLSSNETRRLKDQKATLGPEGLLASGKSIKEAIKSQVLPPPEVLKSIPVADVNSIQFRKMTYYNYTSKSQPEGFELKKIPFNFHLDDINSQFVRFYAFLDTNGISREDRYYLVLLTELWLQSPLRKTNGTIEPYESVLQRRSKDAMSFYNDLGYKGSTFNPGSNSHLIMFYCEAQMSKYEEAVQLLKETLFDVEFNVDKAKTLISQLLNSIPSVKLSTSKMTSALFDNIYFNDKPNIYYASVLRQQKFLEGISKELQHHPASLISKLHQLRQQIVKPENMFVYMATSLDRLRTEHPNASSQPWTEMFDTPTNGVPERLLTRYPTISEHQYRDPKPSIKHGIIGQPGTESCNLKQSIPYDVTDWEIQDVAAMRVMLQYLSDRMYDKIRGKGLTYGISMASSVTEGRTTVSFSRSSQLLDAYARFRQILKNYSSPVGDEPWDLDLLDSAKGSQIYSWAEREETIEDLSSASIKSYLRQNTDPYYNRRFVKRLAKVTLGDVQRLAQKYLPLYDDPNLTRTSVVCGSSDVQGVVENFKQYNIDLTVIEDVSNSILTD